MQVKQWNTKFGHDYLFPREIVLRFDKLDFLGTVNFNQISVREYRRGNQKWTIQRKWQHRVQDEDKQNKNTTQHMLWHNCTQTNTNNVNQAWTLLQTGSKDEQNIVWNNYINDLQRVSQKTGTSKSFRSLWIQVKHRVANIG